MNEKKTVVLVWHNCMECFVRGMQNFLDFHLRSENSMVFLNIIGEHTDVETLSKILGEVDVVISSCDAFSPTDNWVFLKKILGEKKWFVVHKECTFDPREDFRTTETYKWLDNKARTDRSAIHIAEGKIAELNEKVKEIKNKPRLDS
jgi:hypothetical protein